MLLESAATPGGTVAASATATACTETLAGANNVWANSTMVNGKAAGARNMAFFSHTVLQSEEDLTLLILPLTFNPVGYILQAYDANGVFKGTLTDKITVSGNRIQYDFFGSTNLVATDKVMVVAWN